MENKKKAQQIQKKTDEVKKAKKINNIVKQYIKNANAMNKKLQRNKKNMKNTSRKK